MKGAYPVIFTPDNGEILVEVPDMEILTQGKNLANAIEMARDAIGLKGITMEDMGETVPEASDIKDINVNEGTFSDAGEGFISVVDIDFTVYRKKIDNKMVRRNVTLPNWLNQAADAANINVSKILQDALMSKLGVSKF